MLILDILMALLILILGLFFIYFALPVKMRKKEQKNLITPVPYISLEEILKQPLCPIPKEIKNIYSVYEAKNLWYYHDYPTNYEDLRNLTKEIISLCKNELSNWKKKFDNLPGKDLREKLEKLKTEYILLCPSFSPSKKNVNKLIKEHKLAFTAHIFQLIEFLEKVLKEEENQKVELIIYSLMLIHQLLLQYIEFYAMCYAKKNETNCGPVTAMVRKQHNIDLSHIMVRNLTTYPAVSPKDVIPISLFKIRSIIETNLKYEFLRIYGVELPSGKLYSLSLEEVLELLSLLLREEIIKFGNHSIEEIKCLKDFCNEYVHSLEFGFYWQIFFVTFKFWDILMLNFNKDKFCILDKDRYLEFVEKFIRKKKSDATAIYLDIQKISLCKK
ncbi:hypothetical protein [Desulfurobacterium sp.]